MTFKKITTPIFRVSFPEVFKPKAFEDGKDPQFSIQMLFDRNEDLSEIKSEIKRAAQEKWGKKRPKKFRNPLKDGADIDYEGMENYMLLKASTYKKPGIVDQDLNLITEAEADEFYAGCYARATISVSAFDLPMNKGVKFYLLNLQKVDDGEPFVPKSDPTKDFEPIEGKGENNQTEDEDW